MHPDEDGFIRAIAAAPEDEATRLVYADWLEDHGDAARAAYLRAEVACFRLPRLERKYEWAEAEGVDPVWANMVSRAGVLVPGLTLTGTGPRISPDDLKALEAHWGQPLPPDYAALMLLHNGGTVGGRYLPSWREYWDDEGQPKGEYIYGHVRLYALGEKDDQGRPYHRTPASALCPGPLTDDDEWYDFARMMPIGTVTYHDGEGAADIEYLALVMGSEGDRCLVLFCEEDGLSVDDAHDQETVRGLIAKLEGCGPGGTAKTGSPHTLG